jgi:hypothetical protein
MNEAPFADDLPYWKTSPAGADSWLDKAAVEIERAGGEVIGHACGKLPSGGVAYVFQFKAGADVYRLVWPVMEPRYPEDLGAARRQAATALFHDVKARCLAARFMGARAAFVGFMLLPDGRSVAEVASSRPADLPEILAAHKALPRGSEQ